MGTTSVKSHAKLLPSELHSLTIYPSIPPSFTRRLSHSTISRAEILGIVVSLNSTPKFLNFVLDDGTGCVHCILWLNLVNYQPSDGTNPNPDPTAADILESQARMVKMGEQLRVRGRVTLYRGQVQITVRDLMVERDPNMEILHRLDCVRIANKYVAGLT